MPAECEIEINTSGALCGVLAIGRCSLCSRAFCGSHRALQERAGGVTTMVDLCQPCLDGRNREAGKAAQHQVDRTAAAESRVKEMAARLAKADVPMTKYVHASRWKEGMFRDRQVEDPAHHRYGWYVGEFPWRVPDDRPRSEGGSMTRTCRTYVTSDGGIDREGGQGVTWLEGPVALLGEGWIATDEDKRRGFWAAVAESLENLAGHHRA